MLISDSNFLCATLLSEKLHTDFHVTLSQEELTWIAFSLFEQNQPGNDGNHLLTQHADFKALLAKLSNLASLNLEKDETFKQILANQIVYANTTNTLWGDIKPAYAISKTGKAQSPVKIDTLKTKKDAKITNITYKYQPTSFKLIRKDQMIQATAQPAKGRPDSTINVGGKDYTLKTINIHTPAEHQIDNKKMDAELQLVHTSKDNKTVIISVLVKSGAENKAIGDLTSVVANSTNNKEQTLKTTISTLGLIPTNDKHFTYQGSLTTPATTEGVTWFVYETPITMSTKQLDQLKSKLADNNRPTQSLNERVIYSN